MDVQKVKGCPSKLRVDMNEFGKVLPREPQDRISLFVCSTSLSSCFEFSFIGGTLS
jgi:hypothetical protein